MCVFFKTHCLQEFEKWDPDMFPKSQISKIAWSVHWDWAHIKLNLDFWCRVERCRPPFDFFMWAGWRDSAKMDLQNGPPSLSIMVRWALFTRFGVMCWCHYNLDLIRDFHCATAEAEAELLDKGEGGCLTRTSTKQVAGSTAKLGHVQTMNIPLTTIHNVFSISRMICHEISCTIWSEN